MKLPTLLLTILAAISIPLSSRAQQPAPRWSPTVYSSHDKLRQGTKMHVAIHLVFVGPTPSSGNQPFLLRQPLHLELDPLPGLDLSMVEYQKHGDVFRFSISAAANTPPGRYTFPGKLVDYSGFEVKTFRVIFTIEVVPRDAKVRKKRDPCVSPIITPGEILLIPLRVLEGVFEVLIACPLSGRCTS